MTAPNFGSIILGGNVFGWTVSRDDAFTLLDAYLDRGGRAIDTADSYSAFAPGNHGGESEEILGAWLAARKNRDRVVLATKVAKWSAQRGLSPANIAAAIDGSLRRLQTDHLDVYYAHEDDAAVEQADYLAAFDALVKAGKVRTLGASNFTPARLASALEISRARGLAAFEVSQDHWNLVERGIERELVPLLERERIAETPFFALASGFLTGKYRPGADVASARSRGAGRYLADPANVQLLADLDAIAHGHGVSVAAVALALLRAQRSVAAPIASARTVDQLAPLFEQVTLTADELGRLSRRP
ncbi:MAG TPA: aldo/keto reductase [Kofleriaceae bacterium]|nr:aldo/keto reductase [Kofleriaceae bacterium]